MYSSVKCLWRLPPWHEKIAAVLAAAAVLLTGCQHEKGGGKGEADRAATAVVSVVVAPVVQKTVPLFTELTARTDATDSVDIRARVKAFLLTQNYAEGTMVKAGQVLFTLDKREYEAQLMQAKAQLAKAKSDLAQAQEKSLVETAQANLQVAPCAAEQDGSGRQAAQTPGRRAGRTATGLR